MIDRERIEAKIDIIDRNLGKLEAKDDFNSEDF